MSARQYPRQAWVLLPSFKLKQINIVEPAHECSSMFADWDRGDTGKSYHVDKMYPTKADAIAAGRAQLTKMHADIDKRVATMTMRTAALDKAEGAK